MTEDNEFVEPADHAEAESRRQSLTLDVQKIQAQLSDRNRLIDGRRMAEFEWWEWRRRAVGALAFKQAELRAVKAWIHRYHQGAAADRAMRAAGRGDQKAARQQFHDMLRDLLDRADRLEESYAAAVELLADVLPSLGAGGARDRVAAFLAAAESSRN